MTKASWGGNSVFEDPGGRKLGGEIKIFTYRQGGTNTSRHYANKIFHPISLAFFIQAQLREWSIGYVQSSSIKVGKELFQDDHKR